MPTRRGAIRKQSSTHRGSDLVVTEKDPAAGRPQRVSIAVFLDRALAGQIPMIRSLVENAGGDIYWWFSQRSSQPMLLCIEPRGVLERSACASSI